MLSEENKEYYIVSVKLQQVKAFDGHILTNEGDIGWLGKDNGYAQITNTKSHAYKFDRKPDKPAIAYWDGMPWYKRIIPDSVIIYKVREKFVHAYEEEVIA